MSTRRLIAVALLCGLAILVAGGIQLLRISDRSSRTVAVLEEGQSATVNGLTVTVEHSLIDAAGDRIIVGVSLRSADKPTTVPVSSFTLLVGGELEAAGGDAAGEGGGCFGRMPVGADDLSCLLSFSLRRGTATLGFSHGGEQRLWRIHPATG